jgi:hypothetical protein
MTRRAAMSRRTGPRFYRVRVLQGAREVLRAALRDVGAEPEWQGFAEGSTIWFEDCEAFVWLGSPDAEHRLREAGWRRSGGGWFEVREADPVTGEPLRGGG